MLTLTLVSNKTDHLGTKWFQNIVELTSLCQEGVGLKIANNKGFHSSLHYQQPHSPVIAISWQLSKLKGTQTLEIKPSLKPGHFFTSPQPRGTAVTHKGGVSVPEILF